MIPFTLVERSGKDVSFPAHNSQYLLGLYPEFTSGGRSASVLRNCLGLELFSDIGGPLLRAVREIEGTLYVVGADALWRIEPDKSATRLGSIVDDVEATISGNTGNVTVAAGGNYYVWDGEEVREVQGTAFENIGAVEHIDRYTILTEQNGDKLAWSDLADPSSLPALNFATAEFDTDSILRPISAGGYLWLFGTETTEIWGSTQQGGADAFQRLPGQVIETGLKARNLVVRQPAGLFFVGSDGICYITNGSSISPVSRPEVTAALAENEPTNVFYYEDGDNKFCVVRTDNAPAWCFDLATGEWHQRGTGDGAWNVIDTTRLNGEWLGAAITGEIYRFTDIRSDAGEPLVRELVTSQIEQNGMPFSIAILEIFPQVGESGLSDEPKALLSTSKDAGRTFKAKRFKGLGLAGRRKKRVQLNGLGRCFQFCLKVRITDPVDVPLSNKGAIEFG